MDREHEAVKAALTALPRWHVVHWGTPQTSTLLCLWVAGRETLVPIDGTTVSHRGIRHTIANGALVALLRTIQEEQDAAALRSPEASAATQWLLSCWETPGIGLWEFPRGGYVRWLKDERLLVEVGESAGASMPEPLREVLVDLGWNAPNDLLRTCWLQPSVAQVKEAADLAVLTPMAAFGFDAPPPWGV